MNIRIRAAKAGEIDLSPVLPPELQHLQIPESICYGASGDFGQILFQQLDGEGISMLYHTLHFREEDELTYSSTSPVIRLQIVLRNSYYYDSKYFGKGVIHERGISLHYAPGINTIVKLRSQETYSHLSIFYTIEQLASLQTSFPRLTGLLSKVQAGEPVVYNHAYCIASAKILSLVGYMLNTHYTGHLQMTYFGTLAKDVLLEALLRMDESGSGRAVLIGEEEVRKIYHAKEILLRDMHLPFSMSLLVAEVGLSASRLTREFKAIYGIGLKEYLLEVRMKTAIRTLSETDTPVATVARNSGYATPQSFSLAFKNYFGCTPGSVNRRGKTFGGPSSFPSE